MGKETPKPKVINVGSSDERERAVTIRIKESSPKKFAEAVQNTLKDAMGPEYGAKTFKATIVGYAD